MKKRHFAAAHGAVADGQVQQTRRRLFAVLASLYVAQGIPTYLMIMTVPAALRAHGMPLEQIGMLSILMLPMILKFLWAPWVDRFALIPWGHRKGWILCTQLITSAGIVLLSYAGTDDIRLIFAIGACIMLSISTQDIATDGYATQQLQPQDRRIGNAIQASAVAVGVIAGGTLSLILVDHVGWHKTMLIIAVISLLPLLVLPFMHEGVTTHVAGRGAGIVLPGMRQFFMRPGVWLILSVAVLYRLSEGMVRSMESSYQLSRGLQLGDVGLLSGISVLVAGLAGSALAAQWMKHRTQEYVLVALVALRIGLYSLFALHAAGWLGGVWSLGTLAIALSVMRYMEMVPLYALFMSASSSKQPGTDFTILSCAELLSYMISAMAGGVIAKQMDFFGLFVFAAGLSLVSLWLVRRLLRQRSAITHETEAS